MSIAALIQNEIDKRKSKNPQFSLRSFAKLIGVSPGLVSLVVNGKQPLSKKVAAKILNNIALHPADEQDIQRIARSTRTGNPTRQSWSIIAEDEFDLIANWYHYAILGLAGIANNSSNPLWISKKLRISVPEARSAFNRLLRMGLIESDGDHFFQTGTPLTTSTDVPSEAIRRYHRQNLARAEIALDHVDVSKRNFSSATFALNSDDYESICKSIEKLRRRIVESSRKAKPRSANEVYTLAIQFFPAIGLHK